ncbi:MAG: divergent polysaccharide deacetylase family protein [Candidatus Latescibacterota bacterium]
MNRKKNDSITFLVLSVVLAFAAFSTAGIAVYLWYVSNHQKALQNITQLYTVQSDPKGFSEELSTAIRPILSEFGVSKKDIKYAASKLAVNGINYSYSVNIPSKTSLTLLNYKVNILARKIGGKVMSGSESSDSQSLTLILGTRATPTDMIVFKKNLSPVTKQIKAAIIIEDVGLQPVENLIRICNSSQKITLSILPFQRYTEQAVKFASENNIPYILDMPFESKSLKERPQAGSILTIDSETEIVEKLTRAFKNVKGAQGANNHLGSKAVEDIPVMESVMNFLKSNNYFFVDTKASPESAGFKVSQRIGVKSVMTPGYIDNEGNRTAIENRIEMFSNQAIEKGSIIIIGHDRPITISVLKKYLPIFEQKGIRLVRVADIVK